MLMEELMDYFIKANHTMWTKLAHLKNKSVKITKLY